MPIILQNIITIKRLGSPRLWKIPIQFKTIELNYANESKIELLDDYNDD